MSTKSISENSGIRYKGSNYTCLAKTWEYSCPATDASYSKIGAKINCLCPANEPRTVMDQYYINGGFFPISNQRLGWKL
jgi:hypothetical protein